MALKLSGLKILLGITGSIAAYKAANLVRILVKEGAEVKIVLTESAADFVTPLSLSTLSKNPVSSHIHSENEWNNHVDLGLWADYFIIAPATANTIAKLASGICDNLLCACYLSAKCPVFIAPAMDLDMWAHPSTQNNISTLISFGNEIIPVGHGELASGLVGEGRMAEPEEIVEFIISKVSGKKDLKGLKVLITAGPTQESLDPVRYITNHSTGKMGICIAEAAAARGASVDLVLGPTSLTTNHPEVMIHQVTTAEEMFTKCKSLHKASNICVFAAAVADYRPAKKSDQKIKKNDGSSSLELVRNPDIAQELGKLKDASQIHVGFALETSAGLKYAQEKVSKKNFDFIVLNTLADAGAGFKHDTNKVTFLFPHNTHKKFELKSKPLVAKDILNQVQIELKNKE